MSDKAMTLDDLEAIVRGQEARLAALEKQLRCSGDSLNSVVQPLAEHRPLEQPKAAAPDLPVEPPAYKPDLGEDPAALIGREFAKATGPDNLEW
jgi:hypothetical protein